MRNTKYDWTRRVAQLRRAAASRDIAAITQLGLTLRDGIQDRQGRSLVRRNPAYAVRLFRLAAQSGDGQAAGALGHAYDIGQGVRRNTALAIKWYRRAVKHDETIAAANMATVFRDRGHLRLAHQWYLRAMNMDDGDAAVDAGYGYLYGIGVRKDLRTAKRILRAAVRSTFITESGREEALYHLGVAEVDSGRPSRAISLLEQANRDNDYPEAASLLSQIRAKSELAPCRCRRDLLKQLPGHAKCPQHTSKGRSAATKMKR